MRAMSFLAAPIFLVISAMGTALAQGEGSGDFIILQSGDTLYGEVEHIDRNSFSPGYLKKIKLLESTGKKKRFKREDVRAFRSEGSIYERFLLHQETEKITLINPRYNINLQYGEEYFLKVVSKGSLSHYLLEWWDQGDALLQSMDLIKKETDQYFMRATKGIFGLKRKTLEDYFSECPALVGLINAKEVKEIEDVVSYYNNNCQ